MENRDLWQGGLWEQPTRPVPPLPNVTIPRTRKRGKGRKRNRRALFTFLAILMLIVGLGIGIVVTRYVLPQEEPHSETISGTEMEDPFALLERAETGTGVTVTILPREGEVLEATEIYKQCVPSIVSIEAVGDQGFATGTGIVMTEDGYLLTNAHVVAGAREISVLFHDDTRLWAKLVGADGDEDIAVLKVEGQGLIPARFGDSDALECGDMVVAIGDPLGYRASITQGIISALDRVVDVEGVPMTLIQTSAPINFGNSGGALINDRGQVVGITTIKIVSDDGSVEGLGFAIPMSNVKSIADWLIAGKPSLGMMVLETTDQNGLTVVNVDPASGAWEAGIQPGDVVLSLQDMPVNNISQLKAARARLVVGEEARVQIMRDGEERTLNIMIGCEEEYAMQN